LPYSSYDDASVCEEVISKAEENTRTILKPNLVSILEKLNDKMAKDSIVVYNGYAQFFNTDDEETCTKKQDFGWSRVNPKHFNKPKQPLDIARRKRLNSLVIAINNVIKDAIEDVKKNNDLKYKIG
jgi:CRISPR/Cas system CMR subunit Cmr4 (Cas7 group RAMP superfamily)